MVVEVEEGNRQIILLALAKLSIERPGWGYSCRLIAGTLHGVEIFDKFVEIHAGPVKRRIKLNP